MPSLTLLLERVKTPIGLMFIATDEQEALRILDWEDETERMHTLLRQQYKGITVQLRDTTVVSAATRAMEQYFAGNIAIKQSFAGNIAIIDTVKTATGGTDFQRQVWAALRKIPHGKTISYRELAEHIGNPKAVRAVGLANGANPVSIIVPCHRVIGSNQSLTGYGGGLPRKKWLLEHEHALPPETRALNW